jgi:hypothetical protein
MTQVSIIACEISGRGGSGVRAADQPANLQTDSTIPFRPRPADAAGLAESATPVPAPCVIDAVERQLGQAYRPIDTIAANLGTTTASVIEALAVLERRHGIGEFIDVASRDNASVRLRSQ